VTEVVETKTEIHSRLNELEKLGLVLSGTREKNWEQEVPYYLGERVKELETKLDKAPDDIFHAVLKSHKILCEIKKMAPKAAYGQNPGLYYGAGVAGEAGEMCNKIVKALRDGYDYELVRKAIISELPDVIIYAAVLAFCFDLDLTKLVSEKAEVVTQRAVDGYYGKELTD
jgi:NTP pyrophosphatase (non-canonical NTP hydrolase)